MPRDHDALDALLFAEHERLLIERFMKRLEAIDPVMRDACKRSRSSLRRLSGVFRNLPSVLDRRSNGEGTQSIETLVDLLLRDGGDHIILLPTKVVVGRSLLAAKFNFIGFLRRMSTSQSSFGEFRDSLQRMWETAIFLLLVEEVYQVIIDHHDFHDSDLRRKAATDLIHLWEYRSDRNVTTYAGLIVDLWRARRYVAPVFGTMAGTVELLRISSLLSRRWHDFLAVKCSEPEAVYALEEFVFGLSHEEITTVRIVMDTEHMAVIDRDALASILETGFRLPEINGRDPRELYRFYHRRLKAANLRSVTGAEGPRRTLEEVVLSYLIGTEYVPCGDSCGIDAELAQ